MWRVGDAEKNRLIEAVSRHKRDVGGKLPAGPRYEEVERFVISEMREWVGNHGFA